MQYVTGLYLLGMVSRRRYDAKPLVLYKLRVIDSRIDAARTHCTLNPIVNKNWMFLYTLFVYDQSWRVLCRERAVQPEAVLAS